MKITVNENGNRNFTCNCRIQGISPPRQDLDKLSAHLGKIDRIDDPVI